MSTSSVTSSRQTGQKPMVDMMTPGKFGLSLGSILKFKNTGCGSMAMISLSIETGNVKMKTCMTLSTSVSIPLARTLASLVPVSIIYAITQVNWNLNFSVVKRRIMSQFSKSAPIISTVLSNRQIFGPRPMKTQVSKKRCHLTEKKSIGEMNCLVMMRAKIISISLRMKKSFHSTGMTVTSSKA